MTYKSGGARRPAIGLLAEAIRNSYTGGSLKAAVRGLGLQHPSEITSMYLRGEHSDYLAAAVMAVNQSGE